MNEKDKTKNAAVANKAVDVADGAVANKIARQRFIPVSEWK